jgi:hypothetical protein
MSNILLLKHQEDIIAADIAHCQLGLACLEASVYHLNDEVANHSC